jgi:N-glycosylase/DNA lyase
MHPPKIPALSNEYINHYLEHRSVIDERLAEFRAVAEEEYLWEMLYCLLTPQSRAVNAGGVIEKLKERNFLKERFDPTSILRDPEHYIRFHNQKARRLLAAADREEEIREVLTRKDLDAAGRREWLVASINGLGWKEASHFLRNIGHLDLAIIDRHILKHMHLSGAIEAIPASIGTRRVYLELEKRFRDLAAQSGLTLQQLDLLFWSYEEGSVRK